jgi:hypothetical protein
MPANGVEALGALLGPVDEDIGNGFASLSPRAKTG